MNKKKEGQILVVAILVLSILAVIVVGIVSIASLDVAQVVANREYEELYNTAENNIFKLIDTLGDTNIKLDHASLGVLSLFPGQCSFDSLYISYTCEFTDGATHTSVEIKDSSEISDFEVRKDKSLDLILLDPTLFPSGYRGQIYMSWTHGSAIEFSLVYIDGDTNEVKVISDLYDPEDGSTVFTSTGGSLNSGQHNFVFSVNPSNELVFTINNIIGLDINDKPLYLSLTPRLPGEDGIVLISLRGLPVLPKQVRYIEATSYNPGNDTNVLASAYTQIPILPPVVSPLRYVLLVNGIVNK